MTGSIASTLAIIEDRLHAAAVRSEPDELAALVLQAERELEGSSWLRSRVARERLSDLGLFIDLLSQGGLPPLRRRLVSREALRICQSLRLLTGDAGNRWRAGTRGRAHRTVPQDGRRTG